MSNMMIVAGIAVGVIAIGVVMVYSTANQQANMPDNLILTDAAKEGILPKTSSFGADLNKDKWHEDPFADEAALVRAAYEANNP